MPASLSVMAVHLAVRWSVRDHICVRSLERSAGSTASNHGQYEDGTPITNGDIEALADEAGRRYDVDTPAAAPTGRRHPLGSAAASVESVRLDPELKRATLLRRPGTHRRLRSPPRASEHP